MSCYEVVPQQPAISSGESSLYPHLALSHPLLCPPSVPPRVPTVTQCVLEHAVRGAALVPRQALAVMGCEVLRVLQLSDTAILPISFHVPRKVSEGLGMGRGTEGAREGC